MIGRNNQEEEDGCENWAVLSVLEAALRPGLCSGRDRVGGERRSAHVQYKHAVLREAIPPLPLILPTPHEVYRARITIPFS